MLIYLVDDRGVQGEYADFLHAHAQSLISFELKVFTHWAALYQAIEQQKPDVILADMRFDMIPKEELYGDIEGLAATEQFCGNLERAEAQVRGMQGLLICRALREHKIATPIILFASIAPAIERQISSSLAPIKVIQGLILADVRQTLREIEMFKP